MTTSNSTKWNIDNILPEYRPSRERFGATKPSAWAVKHGAGAAVPGLGSCPWCGAATEEIDKSFIAVCVENQEHIVEWIPWGG